MQTDQRIAKRTANRAGADILVFLGRATCGSPAAWMWCDGCGTFGAERAATLAGRAVEAASQDAATHASKCAFKAPKR